MSELQIGLLAIGALVVAGVLAYNRVQERGARRAAEQAFRSAHADVLLEGAARERAVPQEALRPAPRAAVPDETARPDERIDYVVSLALAQPVAIAAIHEHWRPIERRHAPRALLAGSEDGRSWRAGLQLVSREGAVGEADLIEFRSAVESLAAGIGAQVAAPEMRAAVDAARELDTFCAEADVQVVVHVTGGPFAGTKIRAAAEASGLALEPTGRFALRDDRQRLLYTLAAHDGTPFTAETMREAAPQALTLALEVARAPDTRRSFDSMTRLAAQLAALLGGRMADDNGNVLDERGVAAIAQQLDAVRAKLEARGIAPGSAAALRVFS
ncbi:MAG: cell division protein ZipA C-terminal FtsZ-binding domain-containing protein [Pseudomonadota bacterium]